VAPGDWVLNRAGSTPAVGCAVDGSVDRDEDGPEAGEDAPAEGDPAEAEAEIVSVAAALAASVGVDVTEPVDREPASRLPVTTTVTVSAIARIATTPPTDQTSRHLRRSGVGSAD
jgi:hypothetical protein